VGFFKRACSRYRENSTGQARGIFTRQARGIFTRQARGIFTRQARGIFTRQARGIFTRQAVASLVENDTDTNTEVVKRALLSAYERGRARYSGGTKVGKVEPHRVVIDLNRTNINLI
jgi:hypothetical protein